jgi:hypothetical protein
MQKNRLRRGSTGKSAWRRRERGNSLAPRYKRRSDAPPRWRSRKKRQMIANDHQHIHAPGKCLEWPFSHIRLSPRRSSQSFFRVSWYSCNVHMCGGTAHWGGERERGAEARGRACVARRPLSRAARGYLNSKVWQYGAPSSASTSATPPFDNRCGLEF